MSLRYGSKEHFSTIRNEDAAVSAPKVDTTVPQDDLGPFRVQFVAPPRQQPYYLHFGGSDFLEVFLPGQHQQLLHLLSDRPISLVHSEVADAAIPLPVRRAS